MYSQLVRKDTKTSPMSRKYPSAQKAPLAKLALATAVLLSLGITVLCQITNGVWRFEIFQGLVISNGSFSTSIVPTICDCKTRCFSIAICKAWSVDTLPEGKECQLADHYPETSQQPSAIFGVYIEGAPAYTTTTTPPPTTTPIDPTSYELRFFEDSLCSKDRALSGVSVNPGATEKSYIKYTVCFKARINPAFALDTNNMQTVPTGPDSPSEMCQGNRVLVGFESYELHVPMTNTYATALGNNNPPHLLGVCHFLKEWHVDTNNCVTLQPTASSWPGMMDSATLTHTWDYWMSCDPFYLAVQITRELQGNNVRAIASMKCCKIVPIIPMM
ncbi:uncharacterized protein [Palaemon carinicauda]|uniref:uncharacterized protein n=1 Tax=Palaemon carinicauda TaxID=392227 RepID=UPI0035B6A9A2